MSLSAQPPHHAPAVGRDVCGKQGPVERGMPSRGKIRPACRERGCLGGIAAGAEAASGSLADTLVDLGAPCVSCGAQPPHLFPGVGGDLRRGQLAVSVRMPLFGGRGRWARQLGGQGQGCGGTSVAPSPDIRKALVVTLACRHESHGCLQHGGGPGRHYCRRWSCEMGSSGPRRPNRLRWFDDTVSSAASHGRLRVFIARSTSTSACLRRTLQPTARPAALKLGDRSS